MQPSRPLLVALCSGLILLLSTVNGQENGSVAPASTSEPSKPVAPSLECGHWQQNYTALHAAMLKGEIPPRWAIATGPNGLAGGWHHRPWSDGRRLELPPQLCC
jgi:hypothetical protein